MKAQRSITLAIALALVSLGVVACNKTATPTKTVNTFMDAMMNKDVKALKSVMSKEVLEKNEARAKAQNKSLDDMLKEGLDEGAKIFQGAKGTLATRNETIAADGKTATVEFETSRGWQPMHLVKEDDGWKIAIGN